MITKRRASKAGALIAAGLLAMGAHPAPHGSSTPPVATASALARTGTPTEIVDGFHAALKRGDTATALSLLDAQLLVFESGEVERDRAEYAAHHLQADAAFSAAVTRTIEQRNVKMSADMAVISTIEYVTGTYGTRPINNRSLETMVLKKGPAGWRIVHIHWSSARLKSTG